MVDAQAPGVARLLRVAGEVATSGSGWQGRLLDRLGRLHLLARAFVTIDTLPPAVQADLRAAIGFTESQEALLAGPGVQDRWLVLGRHVEDEGKLRVQRTWLWGAASARPALVLAFSAGGQPLDRSLTPGTAFDADLVFFPSAAPLRALVRSRQAAAAALPRLPARSLREATGAYAAALAANPWLERLPLLLGPCALARSADGWLLRDEDGLCLALPAGFAGIWPLLAITGGQPFSMVGEWDGERFAPLCAQTNTQLLVFDA
jgi:hypothetical protein